MTGRADRTGGRTLGIIPARAGSVRLPGKSLRPLGGRPLVDWTLEAARAATTLDRLVVTTDDAGVLARARAHGVEGLARPADLAGPDVPSLDVIAHALAKVGGDWDLVVLLQPTSPLRTAADIDGAVTLCRETAAPAVLSVSPLAKPLDFHGRTDAAGVFHPERPPEGTVAINGAVYVGRPERLFADGGFQAPGAQAWVMPWERGVDIDTLADFRVAEALLGLGED